MADSDDKAAHGPSAETKDNAVASIVVDNDSNVEERFRVDRRKLEQLIQGRACRCSWVRICHVFSRPPLTVAFMAMLQCCVRLLSVTLCIVSKRCILDQKLLLTAYRKLYMRNRLVAK